MDRVGAYNYNRILFYEERKKETPVTQMLRQDTRLQLSIYCNFSYIYIRRCFVFHNPPAFALTLGPVAIVMLLFFFPLPRNREHGEENTKFCCCHVGPCCWGVFTWLRTFSYVFDCIWQIGKKSWETPLTPTGAVHHLWNLWVKKKIMRKKRREFVI